MNYWRMICATGFIFLSAQGLYGCGGGGGSDGEDDSQEPDPTTSLTVNTQAGANGTIMPSSAIVEPGETASFTLAAESGYLIASASGCGGTLNGSEFITGPVTQNCTVSATFVEEEATLYTVTTSTNAGGTITPQQALVAEGESADFTISTQTGYNLANVEGCGGSLSGNTYTTALVTQDCAINVTFVALEPPTAEAGPEQTVNELSDVTLTGTASDSDGEVIDYLWEQISGPGVTLTSTDTLAAGFTAPDVAAPETLVFQLTVTDNDSLTASDTVSVVVLPVNEQSVDVVAAVGDPAADFPDDYVYWSVTNPVIGDSGHIAFTGAADTSVGSTDQNTEALWTGTKDNLMAVFRENTTLPGLPGNVLYQGIYGNDVPIVTTSGFVGHHARLKGAVTNNNNDALLVWGNGQRYTVMRSGDQAAGLPAGHTYGRLVQYAMSDAGMVFSAATGGAGQNLGIGIWYWDFTNIRLIALVDLAELDGKQGTYSVNAESPNIDSGNCKFWFLNLFKPLQINDSGAIAFESQHLSPDESIACSYPVTVLKWYQDEFTLVTHRGSTVPGLTDYEINLGSPSASSMLYSNGDIGLTSTINTDDDLRALSWISKADGGFEFVALGGEAIVESGGASILKSASFLNPPQSGSNGEYLVFTLNQQDPSQIFLLKGEAIPMPYSNIADVGESHLHALVKTGDAPPNGPETGYFANIFVDPTGPSPIVPSINSQGDVVFFAERSDAVDNTIREFGLWRIAPEGSVEKLVETGDSVLHNNSEATVNGVVVGTTFALGLAWAGGPSQHSNTGELFVMSRLSDAYQALLLITP